MKSVGFSKIFRSMFREQKLDQAELETGGYREGLERLDAILQARRTRYRSFAEWEREYENINQKERFVNLASKHEAMMRKLLAAVGIEVSLEKVGKKLFKIPLGKKDFFLGELPQGYAYRGGAARALLHRKLGTDSFASPRDVDISYAGKNENIALSNKLAQELSPDDFAHDHGVSSLNSDYFETQDFSINELLVTADGVYLTTQCLLDNARGILRFSEFEKRESFYGPYFVNPKLLAKALRFIADKDLKFWNSEIFEFQGIDAFHMALHLDRSLEIGYETAVKYVEELRKVGQVPPHIQTPRDLIAILNEETDFVFRFAKRCHIDAEDEFFEQERNFLNEMEDAYRDYPQREGMGKGKRNRS